MVGLLIHIGNFEDNILEYNFFFALLFHEISKYALNNVFVQAYRYLPWL